MQACDPSLLRWRQHACGFTLVELIIVLVMVGVLAVFVAPRTTSTQIITLPAVGERLIATIRYAQSLSMSQGQRYRINFTGSTYQITDMAGGLIVQPVSASPDATSVAPATLSGYNPPLINSYLAFDGRGVPYVSATVALAGSATITVTAGSETKNIVIAPETGRVR